MTRKLENYSAEDLDPIVVGSIHAQSNRYQISFTQAKAVYHLQTNKTALTASVGHSGKLCSVRLGGYRLESQGPVIVWVGSGHQG